MSRAISSRGVYFVADWVSVHGEVYASFLQDCQRGAESVR